MKLETVFARIYRELIEMGCLGCGRQNGGRMGQEKQKAPAGGEKRMSRRTGMLLLLLLFAVLTALAVLASSGALGGLFTSRTTTVEQS